MNLRALTCCLFATLLAAHAADEPAPVPAPAPATAGPTLKISPEMKAALDKLVIPCVKINLEERCVDIESRVCRREGMLELIACTKDSKEHESIIMIEAKPSHVHTALLLLGAKPGNPAMQEALNPEMTRFRFTPPSGNPVDVFLVFKDAQGKETEHPINEFIKAADQDEGTGIPNAAKIPKAAKKFPTHTFLFAGSILEGEDKGPRRYLCDANGNVISLATFGDELLCLPEVHDHSNGALIWEVDGDKLPELNSKIILRLRPQIKP
jgi:hypothetical protein